jgi:hypothetical protein
LIGSLLVSLLSPVPSVAAKDRQRHRHAVPTALSLRVPSPRAGRSGLLDGRMLMLHGPVEDRRSPLAMTSAVIRALKRGVFAGTMKTDTDDRANRLFWTAGGVPLTSLPTNSSLMPYNCHVADRLPGDPASIYRFTVLTIRF